MQVTTGSVVYGIDHGEIITGTLHPLGSGWEIWWDRGGLNTRWPTGDVGLTMAVAWESYARRLKADVMGLESRLDLATTLTLRAREIVDTARHPDGPGLAGVHSRDVYRLAEALVAWDAAAREVGP